MPSLAALTQPNLLLVEGPEDERFWSSLLRSQGRNVEVHNSGGKFGLRRLLGALQLATGFAQVQWIGIVQDADDDPRATWDRIHGELRNVSLPIPPQPWTPSVGAPTTIGFVLPSANSQGDLESLLWQGLSSQQAAPCVDAYIRCLGQAGLAPQRASKARVYAYLASLPDPDLRLSHAVLRGHADTPALRRLLGLIP